MKSWNIKKILTRVGLLGVAPSALILVACQAAVMKPEKEQELESLIREYHDFKKQELAAETPESHIRGKFEKSRELLAALQAAANSLVLKFGKDQKDQTTEEYRRLDPNSLPKYIFYNDREIGEFSKLFTIKILWDTWKEIDYRGQVEVRVVLEVTNEKNFKTQSVLLTSAEDSFRKKGNNGAKAAQYVNGFSVKTEAIEKSLLASEWFEKYKDNLNVALHNPQYPEQENYFKLEIDLEKSFINDISGIVVLKVKVTNLEDAQNTADGDITVTVSGIQLKRDTLKAGVISLNSTDQNRTHDWKNVIYNETILENFKNSPASIVGTRLDASELNNQIQIVENTGHFLLALNNKFKGYDFEVVYNSFAYTNTSMIIGYTITFKNVKDGSATSPNALKDYQFSRSNSIRLLPLNN